MGAIGYHVMKVALADLARAAQIVHVRRLAQVDPGRDRFEVVAVLRALVDVPLCDGEVFEVLRDDAFVQSTLRANPYSHPIQLVHEVEPAGPRVGAEDSEWITFVMRQAESVYAYHPAVKLPLVRKDELMALVPKPLPPPRPWWRRWFGR